MGAGNSGNNGTGSKIRGRLLTLLFDKQTFYDTNLKTFKTIEV